MKPPQNVFHHPSTVDHLLTTASRSTRTLFRVLRELCMYLVDGRGFSTTTTTLVEYFLKESQMEAGQSRWRVKKYIYIYKRERELSICSRHPSPALGTGETSAGARRRGHMLQGFPHIVSCICAMSSEYQEALDWGFGWGLDLSGPRKSSVKPPKTVNLMSTRSRRMVRCTPNHGCSWREC